MMAKRALSTGLPAFDSYIGGLLPGDSLLFVVSHPAAIQPILRSLARAAAEQRLPLTYLSLSGAHHDALSAHPRLRVSKVKGRQRSRRALASAIRRAASIGVKKGFLVIDDLSFLAAGLGERSAIDLADDLVRLAQRKHVVLVSSAQRGEFSPTALGDLKDLVTICLDVQSHEGEPVCNILSRRGKYLAGSVRPLRLRQRDLMKEPPPVPAGQESIPPAQTGVPEVIEIYSQIAAEKSFQSAPQALALFEIDGDFREGNARIQELLGYTAEELRILNPTSVVREKIRLLRFIRELKRKKRGTTPITLVRKNGKPLPAELVASHLTGGLYLVALGDLTAQNKELVELSRKEEASRSMLDQLPLAVAGVTSGHIAYANGAFAQLFGLQGSDAASGLTLRTFLGAEAARGLQKVARESSPGGPAKVIEGDCRTADGRPIHCRLIVHRTVLDGTTVDQIIFLDVTDEKKAIDNLLSSEERYRSLVESTPQPVAIVRDTAIGYVNRAFAEMFEADGPESLIGREIGSIVDVAGREEFQAAWQKLSAPKGSAKPIRFRSPRRDGSAIDCELMLVEPAGRRGAERLLFIRDVTGDLKVRRDLEERVDEIRMLDELVPDLPDVGHLRKLQQAIVTRVLDLLGCDGGSIYLREKKDDTLVAGYHRNMPDLVMSKIPSLDPASGIGGYLSKTQEAHVFATNRYPSYLPYRSLFKDAGMVEVLLIPLLSGDKLVGAMIFWSGEDRRGARRSPEVLTGLGRQAGRSLANAMAYEAMKEEFNKGHSIVESSADVLYTATPAGMIRSVNSAVEKLTGYPPKEFLRTPSLWLKLVHPDDKKTLLERTTRMSGEGIADTSEYRILPRGKAEYRWVRDSVRVQSSGEGLILVGTASDITRLRLSADTYQAEASMSESVLSSLQEGVVVVDRNLRCVEWNPMAETMTGIRHEDAVGKGMRELLPGENAEAVEKLLRQVLEGDTISTAEIYPAPGRGPAKRYLWTRCSPLRGESGEIDGVVCLMADVSEQKTLETEMRESEQVLRNVIDTMGDILIITDLKGTILQVNRAFLRVLGYTRADAVRHEFPYPWLLEEEMGRFVLWISNLRERNWLHDFDMTWRARDGRLIPMSLSTTLLRNSLGEPIAMLNIARDITDRVKLTRDLESRNRQIEMINRIVSKANQTMDFDDVFTAVAKEIRELVPADLISVVLLDENGTSANVHSLSGKHMFWKGRTAAAKHPVACKAIEAGGPIIATDLNAEPHLRAGDSLHKDLRSQISTPIRLKERILGTLDVGSKEPHTFSDETAELLDPIAQQIGSIVDRVRLFNQVTEDSGYIHNLLDSIDSIVYTVDPQLRIREVNKAWYEFMREFDGGRQRNFHGLFLFDVLPDERLKITYQNVVDQILDGRMRIFSEEFEHNTPSGVRTYQLTINPMVIDRKVTGLVFTHTDISALKRTEAELKRNNEQLLALNEISTLISVSHDLTEMLRAALPLLLSTIGAAAAVVYLHNREADELRCASMIGFGETVPESVLRLKRSESATGEAVSRKTALYIEERASDDRRIPPSNQEVLRTGRFEAMAVLPLLSKDNVLGALDIFYRTPHTFSAQDRQILTLVGNQMGAAIESTQLYAELRAQVKRLTALYELSEQLTSTLNIEEIFQRATERLGRVVPFTRISIEFTDSGMNTVTPMYCLEKQEGGNVAVAVARQPVRIYPTSPRADVVATQRSRRSPGGQSIYIPMLSKGTILGIMTIEGEGEAAYTDTHVRLLESIANLTGIALEKGKLYEETLQKSIEIERRNKELDDFTYVVSHDLKEPLISVEGFSKILQADYSEIIQSEGKEYLDSIVGATARMKGLIDDLLLLSRVSRPSESYRQVAVRELLDQVLVDMEFTVRQRGVRVVLADNLPTVECNATQIGIVFRNLIGNAVKFNRSPEPTVEVGFQNAENNSYLFWVKDNGIGIDKDFHEKIFIIFQRLHRREEYEGSGAGLAIVKKIIELHKGKIWVESEPGKGSTFFFTLPRLHAV